MYPPLQERGQGGREEERNRELDVGRRQVMRQKRNERRGGQKKQRKETNLRKEKKEVSQGN